MVYQRNTATETTKGTLFGAYNAITGYFQNVMQYIDDEAELKSILFCNGLNKTRAAFICGDLQSMAKLPLK